MARRHTKTKELQLQSCRDRVESAKKFRKDEGLDDLWERLIDLYAGQHFPPGLSNDDRIAVNIAFSTINVIAPSVSINNPKIVVTARKEEDDDRATITEQLINYQWRHDDVHPEFRRAVDDFLVVGFGWLKTGYRYVEEERDDPQGYADEVDAANHDLDNYAAANPHLAGDLPTPEEVAANIPKTAMHVVEDRPFVERVSIFDVFVDPEATSLRDACWIAQRLERSLSEVMNDENYDSVARSKVQANSRVKDEIRPSGAKARDPKWQRCTIWEFYDIDKGIMCVFAESGEGFLVAPTNQPYEFGQPFVMLRNYDVPDRFYPMGELEAIEPLQHELNATRSAMMNDRKQKRRAWLYQENAFDKKGRTALESNADNRMIPVSGNVPLNDAIVPLPSQQLDPQMYQYSDQIETDVNTITGLSEYARGALPEIRRTATEASIIQDASNSRAADKLGKVEKVIGEVARRMIQLAQQYMTTDQVVRVVGRDGGQMWVPVSPDDIAGEFDFDVEGGSTRPLNEQGRQQNAMQMLQALGPMLVPGGPLNTEEVLRQILKDGFDVKDPERFLAPPPPEAPMADGAPVDPNAPPPPDGGMPPPQGPPPVSPADPTQGGVPPEILAQLQGQVGLNPAQ